MAVEGVTTFEPKPFGRYVLLDKLAVGGMAEIYKAKTYGVDGFEKLLAIKRILPHCAADKEFISMLVDEAKLTVLLSHANIVQVFDLGKVGDDYFISMEYINGTNLREVMRRLAEQGEKIPEETAVYVISEMCKGLDYAHRKTDTQGNPLNIVHRDISPQNILISYEGEVKIVDFGIAKAAMNVSHTMAGILKGKIAYMSPEQALGKPLDHRTDIFSAAIMLYEMLTGEKLYSGESQFEVLNKIRTTRVTANMLPEQISGPLKAILVKGLAYSSKDRYQNAGDFQLDLTKHLYSTYIDFSPRNLAALVSRLFAQELKKRESAPIIDEKTRSVLIRQAAQAQEELVVHGATPQATAITQKTAASVAPKLETQKKIGRAAVIGGLTALLVVGGYLGYRFFAQKEAPPRPPKTISEYGSFQIFTQPVGAKVILNGGETGLTTPASLDKLELGKQYEIRLVKENYREFAKKFTVTSTKPIQVQETLSALDLGTISISSNPQGANIFVNGKESGLKTPTSVENLEINKSYDIKLMLADHAEWNGSVEVKGFDPVKLAATLTTLPKSIIQEPIKPPPPPSDEKKVTPAYGQIDVTSDPLQARILLNG
ncbi:MAG: serine/threonine protein kinase, partial [Deltaproteobacteria bacterium]|nr:serine/threonine protein kinase [Deltaproteobacteria bacterium]